MIAIFQEEIQEHQSLAEHYRQLGQEQEKLAADLLAIEQEASGGFQIFAGIAQKIQDSKAIAKIKSALLNLFDGGDDGGNKPTDPQPDPEPIWENLTAAVGIGGNQPTDSQPDPEPEPTNSPDEFPEAEIVPDEEIVDFEDIEDSGEEADSEDEQEEDTGEEELIYHPDNSAIAWIPAEDGKLSCFVGFEKKSIATSWFGFLQPAFEGIELGAAAVLEGYKYELRCFGLSMGQIAKLAQQDFTKKYHVKSDKIGTAKPPESPKHFIAKSVRVGDRVSRLLTPSEVFEVTCHMSDGTFFAKSLLTGDRQLFSFEDVNLLSSLPEEAPKYATVLLPGDEHLGQKLQIVSQSQSHKNFGTVGYTLRTPSGDYWYSADSVEIHDEAVEAIADATKPTKSTESAPDTHSILGVGDIVQILSDRYPQFHEHIGTVTEITNGMPPIQVKAPRGTKPYHRSELKLISKTLPVPAEEKQLVAAGNDFDPAEDF